MDSDDTLQRQIDELTSRLQAVRQVKHQICNDLMGVVGHAQLLENQTDLSEQARHRIVRIREHCRKLTEQAEELTRLCLLRTPAD